MEQSKFFDLVRNIIRTKHYRKGTELAYVDWIKRFILFRGKRLLKDSDIRGFHDRDAPSGRRPAGYLSTAGC